jgi:UDP-GlcNAc3NAcA epimerase
MKKICTIIGARPQFIKHAPVEVALSKNFDLFTIHTGQHYDFNMSDVFFTELGLQTPKYNLTVGSTSHGAQTAFMLNEIEQILLNEKPDAVLVYGDTNSTIAGALAAQKINIKVIHVESGLRSYNKKMPEEVNRILTDNLSDILFAPTETAVNNLKKENITNNVYNVGDVMFDSILSAKQKILNQFENSNKILLTIHRPYNTDNIIRLTTILDLLNQLNESIIFPIHPRTRNILSNAKVDLFKFMNIEFIEPVSYLELIKLQLQSFCIITDSGGVQKEAYMLKKKCITIRTETEWIETLKNNWNTLIFDDLNMIKTEIYNLPGKYEEGLYGKGDSSIQIYKILSNIL